MRRMAIICLSHFLTKLATTFDLCRCSLPTQELETQTGRSTTCSLCRCGMKWPNPCAKTVSLCLSFWPKRARTSSWFGSFRRISSEAAVWSWRTLIKKIIEDFELRTEAWTRYSKQYSANSSNSFRFEHGTSHLFDCITHDGTCFPAYILAMFWTKPFIEVVYRISVHSRFQELSFQVLIVFSKVVGTYFWVPDWEELEGSQEEKTDFGECSQFSWWTTS